MADLNASSAASGGPPENSAPEALEKLIQEAEMAGASDLHLHAQPGGTVVCYRLDGVMTPAATLPAELGERLLGRVKFLARLKTYQESLPQDGRIDKAALKAQSDIRVSTYPTVTGEKVVLRFFNTAVARGLGELGFPTEAQIELERFLAQTTGMMLLTGPAGSGKTTTIYACLRCLGQGGGRHIITIEDPVEQILPGIMQTEVCEARGLDFAKAARHLLRQDPQALVLGEIRDDETANIAVRAALTGHLVISTLHAGSCRGVFERLLVLCGDHSAVAASTELVVNQRLVRRLCPDCAGRGCAGCLTTGYRGRLPMVEWVRVDDVLRCQLRSRDVQSLTVERSLAESARHLIESGLTSEAEVVRVLGSDARPPRTESAKPAGAGPP